MIDSAVLASFNPSAAEALPAVELNFDKCDIMKLIDWSEMYCSNIERAATALEKYGCPEAAREGRDHLNRGDCKASPEPGGGGAPTPGDTQPAGPGLW